MDQLIEQEFTKRFPGGENFHTWIDRQIRPTIGATVKKGVGRNRQDVGDPTFAKMLETLTNVCQTLIPEHSTDVFVEYSCGSWQRSQEFHLKAHLTTTAFLCLTDKLRESANCGGSNPLRSPAVKNELEKRERRDNCGNKLREFFESKYHAVYRKGNVQVVKVQELDYPLLGLYQGNGSNTSQIPAGDMPTALNVLEDVALNWSGGGFSIGMVLCESSSPSTTYQVAAIVDEKAIATRVGKEEEAVQKSWGWTEPKRKYH